MGSRVPPTCHYSTRVPGLLRYHHPFQGQPQAGFRGIATNRLGDRLTERQFEVIQTAYYSGYFESPRGNSGEVVAETLGISPQAFYRHVRTVQRKLFDTLFDDATDGGVSQ